MAVASLLLRVFHMALTDIGITIATARRNIYREANKNRLSLEVGATNRELTL